MAKKIRLQKISEALKCPLYVYDTENKRQCLIKFLNTLPTIENILEDSESPSDSLEPQEWYKDCCGNWSNCQLLSLLYDFSEDEEQVDNSNTPEVVTAEASPEDEYDPFGDSGEEEEEEEVPVIEPELEPDKKSVNVFVNLIADPYRAKADALIIPANSNLIIDDDLLNKHSRWSVQKELEKYLGNAKMGMVLPTTNGIGNVIPPKLYHAVIAGPSRLVTHDIKPIVVKSLIMADEGGAKIVAMMPLDGGVNDVEETAREQLKAIATFIEKTNIKNIERIHIVIEDQESVDIWTKYLARIF